MNKKLADGYGHLSAPFFYRISGILAKNTYFFSALSEGAPYGITPRVYCAANPLRYTDPTGMNYNVTAETNSIEFHSYYIVNSDAVNYANQGKEIIESNSNIWGLELEYKGELLIIPIIFSVEVEEIEGDPERTVQSIRSSDFGNSPTEASMLLIDNKKVDKNAGVYTEGRISISSDNASESTSAHEMGHGLGAQHSNYGLMTESSQNLRRTNFFTKSNISQILNNTVKNINGGDKAKSGALCRDNNSNNDIIINLHKAKVVKLKK